MAQPYPQYPQSQWAPPQYQQPQAGAPKEIPITLVIAGVIVVWILVMGGTLGYVSVAPCAFLNTALGADNLAKLQDQNNLETPCTFAKDSFSCQAACSGRPAARCTVWKLDNNDGCRQFIIEATTK